MAAAGASADVLVTGFGSGVATSFLRRQLQADGNGGRHREREHPGDEQGERAGLSELPSAAGNAGCVEVLGIVAEREVDVLCGGQRRTTRKGELGFRGSEHRHGQGFFEDRHERVESPPEPTMTSASGCQSARVKTVLSHLIRCFVGNDAWLTAVCTAPSRCCTISAITDSGSMTHTAVVP